MRTQVWAALLAIAGSAAMAVAQEQYVYPAKGQSAQQQDKEALRS